MKRGRSGVIAGLSATVMMVGVMFVSRFTWETPLLPELIAQRVFALVTPAQFSAAVRVLGFGAKWVAFGLAVVGYIAGGVGLGWLYARIATPQTRSPSLGSGLVYGACVWLVLMTLGMPLLGGGLFGVALRGSAVVNALALLGLHLLYGGLLGWMTGRVMDGAGRTDPLPIPSLSRRTWLRGVAVMPGVWLAASALGQLIGTLGMRLAAAGEIIFEAVKGLSSEVTPNDKFYTISKNLFNPTVNARTWSLKIHGLVENPLQVSLEALKTMPPYVAYATFVCISNEVGGNLISNAQWKGVRVKDLLERARVRPGARKVIFRADDGYSTGIPLDRCLRPQTFLAYEMNGQELPHDHGFPVRAVIPGYYGMKQPKWLTEIEVVDYDYKGYWEERDWADEAVVKTMSRFDGPRHRGEVSRTGAAVGGVAFAGERGISKVEVSPDGGKTWQEAHVKEPLSPYTWVLWGAALEFPAAGEALLAVRATDGQGSVQEERVSDPLPTGATGYHKIRVKVKAP